jgi:hypothetical protein
VGALAADGGGLISAFHGMSFLAGAGHIPPGRDVAKHKKNLLKNRVLDPPSRLYVKFALTAPLGGERRCLWITPSKGSKIRFRIPCSFMPPQIQLWIPSGTFAKSASAPI